MRSDPGSNFVEINILNYIPITKSYKTRNDDVRQVTDKKTPARQVIFF